MSKNDEIFRERDIFSDSMYVKGVYPAVVTEKTGFVYKDKEDCEARSVVVPMKFGSVYVVRFPNKTDRLRAAVVSGDPAALPVGGSIAYDVEKSKAFFEGEPDKWNDFMYTPLKPDEYLVIYTSDKENIPVYVGENPVLIGYDTDDEWFKAGPQKDLHGTPDSWGNWAWTSDEVLEHVYEPLRRANPDYITRRCIGKDEALKYDMWAYFFEPAGYEQTIFITGGIHAAEMDGYLGLARFFELMVNEDGSNAGLHYLRTKVRIILIPIVNVYSASEQHIRQNSRGADLNRDFELHMQGETINVIWLLQQYKNEIAALIDCHTCGQKSFDLYYQFSIQAVNSQMCRRVTNHIYEDLKKRGLVSDPVRMDLIPGGYEKHDKYLQGYAQNRLGIPTLVVEHEDRKYAEHHSALGVELAAEYYGNFIIQTALSKFKLNK